MRRIALIAAVVTAFGLAAGSPAAASSSGGWEPAPSSPATAPAGSRCDFAVHLDQVVDDVQKRVLATYPDGSVQREEYKGPLIVRVTNVDTGKSVDVNASGHAFVDYHPDGSYTWSWTGPVLMGFGDASNHAKGLYLLTGEYIVDFVDGYRLVRYAEGAERDLCAELS